jgi:alpha-L-rhamnosidase
MIAHGATTIWERWNGDVGDRGMNSFNHYALGAVAGFLFRRLAGIDPVEPGFARFRFDPVYDPRMANGGGRYDSQSGTIITDWKQKAGGVFTLDISVPPNARCTLCLPARTLADVSEGGRPVSGRPGMTPIPDARKIAIDLGSGDYGFSVVHADYS